MTSAVKVSPDCFGQITSSDVRGWKAEMAKDPAFAKVLAAAFGQWLAKATDDDHDQDRIFSAAAHLEHFDFWSQIRFEDFVKSISRNITVKTRNTLCDAFFNFEKKRVIISQRIDDLLKEMRGQGRKDVCEMLMTLRARAQTEPDNRLLADLVIVVEIATLFVEIIASQHPQEAVP
jgi:hypothetical protein